MPRLTIRHGLFAILLAAALPLAAQERTLHWSDVTVRAHLDAEGTLHVAERQTFVFTGDWNGGYRSFRLPLGQRLQLERLVRIDERSGQPVPLVEGDLDQVDHYAWAKGKTLRWRSRLPSDPPFQDTALTYEIGYTLTGILEKKDSLYRLDNNFIFVDREGVVDRFTLDLDFAPVWAAAPVHVERAHLPPGADVLVTRDLRYQGEGRPAGVRWSPPAGLRGAFFLAALVAMAWLYFRFRDGEAALGRWQPSGAPENPDSAWLEANLFAYLPEEVGALWDRKVGPPEVAATLARLVAEGKLASEVVPARMVFGLVRIGQDVLRLRRTAPPAVFTDYEERLVDRLFFDGRTEVDTGEIRQHYKSTGFDPAQEIRAGLEKRLAGHAELRGQTPPPRRRPTVLLLLAAALCFVLDGPLFWAQSVVLALVISALSLLFYVPGLIAAFAWRKRVERLNAASLSFLLPGLAVFGVCCGAAFFSEPGLFGCLGLALIPVTVLNSLLNNARSRETAETIRRRQTLAAGRRWLQRELRRPQPALRDDWFPYLLAFGLNSDVDRWFRSFGGAAAVGRMAGSTSSFGGSGGGGIDGGGWTGGGGAFGGGGATGTWAVAAAGLASGVAAPSSSSSGGSGGGGGGGGGGGW